MKKTMNYLIGIFFLLSAMSTSAQDHSPVPLPDYVVPTCDPRKPCCDTSDNNKFSLTGMLSTRNVFRGVSYGESPSIQFGMSYWTHGFTFGITGTATTNGKTEGFGNVLENYISYALVSEDKLGLTLTVDDYFLFDTASNDYFNYNTNITKHYIETRAELAIGSMPNVDGARLTLLASYVPYQNKNNNSNTLYFEGNLRINKNLNLTLGGVTGSSDLLFYTKSGICNVGVTVLKDLKIFSVPTVCKGAVIFNPNYDNITRTNGTKIAGIGYNPVNFVFSICF